MNESHSSMRLHLPKPGLQSTPIPPKWRDDPFLRDRIYFTLPRKLLDLLKIQVGRDRFEPFALQREEDLTNALGETQSIVGFWNMVPITYHYLFPRQIVEFDEHERESLGKDTEQCRQLEKVATDRLDCFEEPIRGYVGWLLTQPKFLSEHDELVARHREQIRKVGFPQPWQTPPAEAVIESPADSEWVAEFHEFYLRWCLRSLAAPGLPIPLAPRVPDVMDASQPHGVQTVTVPDICPIPGKGTVVETFEDALHGTESPTHLKAWLEIVSRSNPARNQIPAFERRFRLQHYWRILQHRYPDALTRKKGVLTGVFADFLETSDDTIKGDLRFLSRQLGADWGDRPLELC